MLRFDEPFKSILVVRLIESISFLYYTFTEFIILLHPFLAISFAGYKEYMICLISFSKCLDVLTAFNCGRAIGNH